MVDKKIILIGAGVLVLGGAIAVGVFIGKQQKPQTAMPQPTAQVTPGTTITGIPTPTDTPIPTTTTKPTPTPKPTTTPTQTPTPTPTPTPGVINIEDSVSPTTSSACSQVFTFTGKIFTNAATTVTYKWNRSDGAGAMTQTLTFTSASMQTVTDTWSLGPEASGTHVNGWERIEILTPNSTLGNQAEFTLSCP